MKPLKDSLVLYKQSPALVTSEGEKIDILLPGGKTRSVREKDIFPLHPGPVSGYPDLESGIPEGQPEEAWELLQGESPSLEELAELVFGEFTPKTSWAAFKLLNRSPWFGGTPDAIVIVDEESVARRIKADEEKAEAEERWNDFLERFRKGTIDREADELFLRDLEMYALGRSKGSRILKALGKTQSPENAHRVMLSHGVKDSGWNPHPLRLDVPLDPPDFPLGEMAEVERLDLTSTEAFAIDDEGNQDPDDAVAWDGERFWVHVADAAGLVIPGSEADEIARERASSLYLPEKTVPMLPPEAARRLGLGLAETSPALSYAFTIDSEGFPADFSIHLTTVRVTRLTYAEADERMEEEPFATMKRITDAFRKRRLENGAVSISMPEVKIRVTDDGEIIITPLPELAGREMVTEAMLMAGSYAARWCLEKEIPIPFAVQETSGDGVLFAEDDGDTDNADDIASAAAAEGSANGAAADSEGGGDEGGVDADEAGSGRGKPDADEAGSESAPDFSETGEAVPEKPSETETGEAEIENTSASRTGTASGITQQRTSSSGSSVEEADYAEQFSRRRGMKRSRTTLECSRHSGLGLDAYSRVTSPLRRYPDLIASQQIRRTILRQEPLDAENVLMGLAAFETRSGSLIQSERRSNLFWKLKWLEQRQGWTGEAVLLDRRERQGIFLIPEIALETRVAMKKDVPLGGRAILALKSVDIPESSALFVVKEVL